MRHYTNTLQLSRTKAGMQLHYLKTLISSFSEKAPEKKTYTLEVDTHGHWLPGVDDGAQTVEEGLKIVRGLTELGYRKLIATPHIRYDFYNNDPEVLSYVFKQFQETVKKAGIKVKLGLAAEYKLDEGFTKHLEAGPLLTLKDKLVLFEMSFFQAFPGLKEIIFEMQLQGYQPVLAHPERYEYYYKNMEIFEELKDAGCFFQLNLLAINGYYGKQAAETARNLMQLGWYEFAGTDIHNARHLKKLAEVEVTDPFQNSELL